MKEKPCKICGATNKRKDGRCYPCNVRRQRAYAQRNKAKLNEKVKRWQKANPFTSTANTQRARAKRARVPGNHSGHQLRSRWEYYGGYCWICLLAKAQCVDHVIAMANGGSNWPSNIRPACKRCNDAKSVWEMRGSKPSARKIESWALSVRIGQLDLLMPEVARRTQRGN
jgi:5-methylcytosine-specific restriction endonuclease McrA